MSTIIHSAASVIARRDAESPACENTLKKINDRLLDTEYVRAIGHGTFLVKVEDYLTPTDVNKVNDALVHAGYVAIEFKLHGTVISNITFRLPTPSKDLL